MIIKSIQEFVKADGDGDGGVKLTIGEIETELDVVAEGSGEPFGFYKYTTRLTPTAARDLAVELCWAADDAQGVTRCAAVVCYYEKDKPAAVEPEATDEPVRIWS